MAHGALPQVYAAATHAVLSGPAHKRLEAAKFAEIVVTDTIPLRESAKNITVLSVAPLLKKVL